VKQPVDEVAKQQQ